jgi:hypothetical protein
MKKYLQFHLKGLLSPLLIDAECMLRRWLLAPIEEPLACWFRPPFFYYYFFFSIIVFSNFSINDIWVCSSWVAFTISWGDLALLRAGWVPLGFFACCFYCCVFTCLSTWSMVWIREDIPESKRRSSSWKLRVNSLMSSLSPWIES